MKLTCSIWPDDCFPKCATRRPTIPVPPCGAAKEIGNQNSLERPPWSFVGYAGRCRLHATVPRTPPSISASREFRVADRFFFHPWRPLIGIRYQSPGSSVESREHGSGPDKEFPV